MTKPLAGVLPIVHTPFDERNEIDWPVLQAEVAWAFAQGIDGLGTGMVSEIARLSASERREYAQRLVEFAAGKGPVFMAVTAASARESLVFARDAEQAGCSAIMAAPPLEEKLSPDELKAFYLALADEVSPPVIVQDASGYLGQPIPIAVCVDLLRRYGKDKILFKPEGMPNGPNLSALRDATGGEARLFEGSGGIYLIDSFRRGVAGTMPGIELLDAIVAIWRALQRGDDETAYRLYFPVCAIVALQVQAGLDGFLAIEKHLLVKRGLFPSVRRREPIKWQLDRETAEEVNRLFARLMSSFNP